MSGSVDMSARSAHGATASVTLTISLFGAFRPYGSGDAIMLEVSQGTSVSEVKNHLKAALKKVHPDFDREALVDESALADETQILAEDMTFSASATLAILPPVCGG